MTMRRKAVRGSFQLAFAEGVAAAASFVRNMILARMLTKADFGIAATFSLILTLIEFSAKLGVARFVVRDKEGNDPDFIAAAHLMQFAGAALSAAAIAALAVPLSRLFGLPNQAAAIALLALAPLLRGLEHLDVRRYERDLRFGPSLLVEAVPQVLITLAAWPVTAWFGDYRALLVLLLAKAFFCTIGTHVLKERPYRWQIHRAYISRMWRFGWPLIINGFLLFGVLHGDQLLVATFYSMADLGAYAAAATLNLAPTFFFGRVFNTVALPVLAGVQDDAAAFARRYRQVLAVMTLFATVCSLGMILGAEALMQLVYGAKYAGGGPLLAWLAAANGFRNLRIAPALAAIAKGDSENQMRSNWWRVVALLPASACALTRQPVWTIACTGLLGEALACWASFLRLRRHDGVPLADSLAAAGMTLLATGVAGAIAASGFYRLHAGAGLALAAIGATVGAAGMIAALPELRVEVGRLYAGWRGSGWRGCFEILGWGNLEAGAAESAVPPPQRARRR